MRISANRSPLTCLLYTSELLTNPPPGGIRELREAIADYLFQFRGMSVSPEQIIIGAGTEYLYGLLIQLLGRDKVFAVEDPGYRKIAQIYASNCVKCCYLPLDSSGVDVAALEASGAQILHTSPSHHFPTGIITPISRRYAPVSYTHLDCQNCSISIPFLLLIAG